MPASPAPTPTSRPANPNSTPARARRRSRRPIAVRTAAMLSLAALVGGACTSGNSDQSGLPSATTGKSFTRQLTLASALQPFTACDDLLDYLHKEGADRVTAYGLAGTGGYFGGPAIMEDGMAVRTEALNATTVPASGAPTAVVDAVSSGEGAGPTFSSTNTVEAGIDEADVVKTDGTHLYLISQGQLQVVATNGGQPQKLASLALPGFASQLLKVGNTLLVLGQPEYVQPAGEGERGARDGLSMPVPGIMQQALWQVDVANPGSPKLQRQLIVDGTIIGARLTGEVARVVVQSSPQALPFVYPAGPSGEDRAEKTNREIIEESKIEDWIGGYELRDAGGETISEGMLAGCTSVARPPTFHGFSTTTVLSVDLSRGLSEPNGASVLADGQQIYSSKDHLYVAIGAWQDPGIMVEDGATNPEDQDRVTTAIHRFSYDSGSSAYTATGEVTGSLMNDFSMSEHDGVLRVATTAGAPWFWGMGPNSESFVTTLRETDGELAEVGRVGGLGKGERIYAVRFIGTNGYVVTFRQTDPLYVVNLTDPAQPTVTGELKIPGYSAYLHPVGDGRLLGIGQDASEEGRVTGGQVSLFDVSDPTNPQRIAQHSIGTGQLNAEFDYKAFLWWAPENLVLLPANTYGDQGQFFSGVIGINVGDTTLAERGRISATPAQDNCATPAPAVSDGGSGGSDGSSGATEPDVASSSPGFGGCNWYGGFISRSVVVDDVVYGIGEGFVSASDISDLSPLGQANLF
ncbi:MAG: beta-propeller domain-containing protein [Acidimicrobiales bacterium]